MSEAWKTILFLVAIPLVQQAIKLIVDRRGEPLGKLANQLISLALAAIFFVLSGGIAGLDFPALPVCADVVGCVGGVIDFLGALAAFLAVAWGSLMAIYEMIWDRLFTAVRLATADKYS